MIQKFVASKVVASKVCHIMSTYLNAHAKIKKLIFDIQFPGNRFQLGIIKNDFWSSTIWAIQIQASFPEFKNPKNPGIQPIHELKMDRFQLWPTKFGVVLSLPSPATNQMLFELTKSDGK